jgi:hypothetical protein
MYLLDKVKNLYNSLFKSYSIEKTSDGVLHIKSDLPVAVDSAKSVIIGSDVVKIDIHSETTVNIYNNTRINSLGSMHITAGDEIFIKSGGRFAIDAPRIDLNSGVADSLNLLSTTKQLDFDD